MTLKWFTVSAVALLLMIPLAGRTQTEPIPEVPIPAAVQRPVALPQGSVTGHIFCADTRTPARGARVMLIPVSALDRKSGQEGNTGSPLMAITALDGGYSVSHVAPGEYFLAAFAAGYLSPFDGLTVNKSGDGVDAAGAIDKRASGPVIRISGDESARGDLELRRGAVLAGRILYSDGSPASEMHVVLEKSDEPKPARSPGEVVDLGSLLKTFMLQQSYATDDQGHFRLSGISPGSYRLAVPQNFDTAGMQDDLILAMNPASATGGKLTVYAGNTLHRKDAKVYDLHPGDSLSDIEITLPLAGLHSIHGLATGVDGTPVAFASLDLTDTTDSSMTFHTTVRPDGAFRFTAVPEGTYELKATNARIYDHPLSEDVSEQSLPYLQQQYRTVRAFADMTQKLVVQTSDIDNLGLTLPDTKLPGPPKSGASADQ